MSERSSRLLALGAVGLAAMLFIDQARAQPGETGWRPFVSVAPLYEAETDLDQGGNVDVVGVIARAGLGRSFADGARLGVTVNYDHLDFSFSDPAAFGGLAPWDDLQRHGVGLSWTIPVRSGWFVGISPSVDWFRESGASSGDSVVWGGFVNAVRVFADGNRLGLGVAAFDGIEETRFFPVPVIDWRLGERWRLTNPVPSGPTGPAGLEARLALDENWSAGFGAAYRSGRYRLSRSGPVPDGVGEVTGIPLFARATRRFGRKRPANPNTTPYRAGFGIFKISGVRFCGSRASMSSGCRAFGSVSNR